MAVERSPDRGENGGPTRAGFVALVGAPNAGKSTLLNALVGAKVSIVTPKVQTTRSRILGICVEGASQLVFVDTPGIFQPRRRLERAMVSAAWSGARDADLVVLVIDAAASVRARSSIDPDGARIVDELKSVGRAAICAINKVDLVARPKLLAVADALDKRGRFTDMFMISALSGDGVADMRAALAAKLPLGPWLYPEDQLSDMNERLVAAEITREKLFLALRQELPYALTVETESWRRLADGSLRIEQIVYVMRDSQKAIVLGKAGHQIKAIGAAARIELEQILGCRVHLFLHLKVREHWPDDPERYREMGLDFEG